MPRLKAGEVIYETSVERVKHRIGARAVDVIGPELYRALIVEAAFFTIAAQDDSISDETVRRLLKETHTAIAERHS